jgi:glycosyltransferase involved in cell wall biosynthesis
VEELAKQRADFKVLVVGSDSKGKFLAEVQSSIKTKGLEQFFVFLGTRSDMRELYSISEVSLSLTSTTAESFGRAVVESLALGTPVVAYEHGAVKETLDACFPDGKVAVNDLNIISLKVLQVFDGLLANDESIPRAFTLKHQKNLTINLYRSLRSITI